MKCESLCGEEFSELYAYMQDMFENCPHDNFTEGPRSSALRFNINVEAIKLDGHEVCSLAEVGLQSTRYKTAHSNVQVLMLEEDNKTIGVEVPIWMHHEELDRYKEIFKTDEPLSGHIDALRIEDGKIWVWDFKPKAHKEKYASTQIFFYALMLSKRTGIDLDHFRCGYFDENLAYVFKPSLEQLVPPS